jgi:hypothetical protein
MNIAIIIIIIIIIRHFIIRYAIFILH